LHLSGLSFVAVRSCAQALALLTLDQAFDLGPVLLRDHSKEKLAGQGISARTEFRERPLDAFDLDLCQFVGEPRAFGRNVEAAFTPVLVPGPLDDETFVDELFQNARQRLLGDFQNFE
jgi:hypothetical protein